MMHTLSTPERTKDVRSIASLFTRIGDFALRAQFYPLVVTPGILAARRAMLDAIIFADDVDWQALQRGKAGLLFAILKYEARRLEGTWVGGEGRPGRLRFENEGDRKEYRYRLGLAISATMKHLHPL